MRRAATCSGRRKRLRTRSPPLRAAHSTWRRARRPRPSTSSSSSTRASGLACSSPISPAPWPRSGPWPPSRPDAEARVAGGRTRAALPTTHPSSIAGEGHARLLGEIDERLAADVDDRLVDRAADEHPRLLAGIVVGDGLAAVLPDVEPLPGEREIRRLRLDPAFTDRLVPDVQGESALGRQGAALPLERGREDDVTEREGLGGLDHLLLE